MQIEQLDPDDRATIADVVALLNAGNAVDSPWAHPETVADLAGRVRFGGDGKPSPRFAARENGDVVGYAMLDIGEWDNTHLAWLDLSVHPRLRGAGRGTELLEFLLDAARSRGCTSVGGSAFDNAAARAFAARHGFEPRSEAVNRRQHLAEVDRALVDKLYGEAAAAAHAYELVRIAGRTPDALLDAVVTMSAAINDAPLDDLEVEDEVYSAERVRGYEDANLARGQRLYRLVARHRATGELAGHTVVAVEEERPGIGHQHDTSVVRAHRGHRLGLLLKAGMLQWLAEEEPALETVDTWNAASNDHMIGVNEALGYRVVGRAVHFQRAL